VEKFFCELNNLNQPFADFDQAINLNPNNAKYYRNRGKVYQLQNQLDKAITDYDKAINLDPNDTDLFIWRGKAYRCLVNSSKHLRIFTKPFP
jgi:tetratricopeptide (TPR) repeat protein